MPRTPLRAEHKVSRDRAAGSRAASASTVRLLQIRGLGLEQDWREGGRCAEMSEAGRVRDSAVHLSRPTQLSQVSISDLSN